LTLSPRRGVEMCIACVRARACVRECMCVRGRGPCRACVCVCVRARVRACVRACVRADRWAVCGGECEHACGWQRMRMQQGAWGASPGGQADLDLAQQQRVAPRSIGGVSLPAHPYLASRQVPPCLPPSSTRPAAGAAHTLNRRQGIPIAHLPSSPSSLSRSPALPPSLPPARPLPFLVASLPPASRPQIRPTITDVIDDKHFKIDTTLNTSNIYVYGSLTDDIHAITKEAINALHVSPAMEMAASKEPLL